MGSKVVDGGNGQRWWLPFNAVGFVWGLKGNDSFGRELNGLK
jgi:hypothetical protein